MDTSQSILKQPTVLSTFKGHLAECPCLLIPPRATTVMPGFQPPVKHLPVFLEASGKSQCPSTCMFSLSLSNSPHKTGLKEGRDGWNFPYETCPAVTDFCNVCFLKNSHNSPSFDVQPVSQV